MRTIAPNVAQLGLMSPTRVSRKPVLIQEDKVVAVNSGANHTLTETSPLDVEYHSEISIHFWTRMSPQMAFGVGETILVEVYRTVGGVTTAMNYPIYHKGPVGDVVTAGKFADPAGFIHQPQSPVVYGIRARIDGFIAAAVNCRMFGLRVEFYPTVVTR